MLQYIIISKTERQLLLYEIFLNFYLWDLDTIQTVIPVERRMLQRDIRDLVDAGLISVVFSKKEQAYVQADEEVSFHEDKNKPARTRHLKVLNRLGTLMEKLDNDEISQDEKYDRKKYKSCKEVYEELLPGVSARTRQRDFETLNRIGYPIRYNRRIQYYEFYEKNEYRTDFGLYRRNGRLMRNTSTDYEVQSIPWFEIENPDIFDDEEDW